jgi:dihydrofolate reductase
MTDVRASLTLVAAVARNGTIGADGGLPWHLPADLRHFKAVTMGHPMIMGRRTFESIGRALPGRRTIVITRDRDWTAPGVDVVHSVPSAIATAAAIDPVDGQVMVVGGGEIYRQTMPLADRLEITHVDADVAGDTLFPTIDPADWREAARTQADGYAFVSYVRAGPVRDLAVLLRSMKPVRNAGEYVFCSVSHYSGFPPGVEPVVTVSEPEGLTIVITAGQARAAGLSGIFPCAWITLTVNSALDAVGLTAAVATALTRDGISCNVVAGYHHDHLFVPIDQAQQALSALAALAHTTA